jgi:hypothetical protein
LVAIEPAHDGHVKGRPRVERSGVGFQNRDRKTLLDEASWSDLADNFEDTDSRDELYCSTMAWIGAWLDIPSLVPSAYPLEHPGSVDRPAPFLLGPHLRC